MQLAGALSMFKDALEAMRVRHLMAEALKSRN